VKKSAHIEAAQSRKSSAPRNTTKEDAEQIAQADVLGDRVNTADVQQWVVLARWEEVQTLSPASNSAADYDATATAAIAARSNAAIGPVQKGDPKGRSESKSSDEASRTYTVTQLILKVVPANPKSGSIQPSLVRSGWFVIQL
jgi:hypothetical protein